MLLRLLKGVRHVFNSCLAIGGLTVLLVADYLILFFFFVFQLNNLFLLEQTKLLNSRLNTHMNSSSSRIYFANAERKKKSIFLYRDCDSVFFNRHEKGAEKYAGVRIIWLSKNPRIQILSPEFFYLWDIYIFPLNYCKVISSVADPFYFDTDPVPRIRFVETRLWIILTLFITFFLLITQKIIY